MLNFWVYFCCFSWLMGPFTVFGSVVLIGRNVTLSFDGIEANFAPSVKRSGKCGILFTGKPLDACLPLANKIVPKFNDSKSPLVLIIRGGCSFEDKVRRAQAAGFRAAIVYDDKNGDLVAMAGNPAGIRIPAVFISRASGETLAKYAGVDDMELRIFPSFESSAWSILVSSFISLLIMSALLATCFFARRQRRRREHPRASRVQELHGMSCRLVKAMPSLTFTAVLEDNCTSRMCAICLEEYKVGETLRILPCCHKFHAICVDAWLTSRRTFCPVCKHDARTSNTAQQSSEFTPLLSSSPASTSVASILSTSSAIQISPSSSPYNQSTQLITSRSSVDLTYMSSQLPQLPIYPSLSTLNSRCISSYVSNPGNASSTYFGSSTHYKNSLHYSDSAASFSPFASNQSLPGFQTDCG